MSQNVVITGASAGIARATAQQFGARGANVGLLARGQAGLDGAVADIERAGGKALAVPTDVADYDQVEAAAQRVEEAFGPIDVWINVAFTSVFAPFIEIKPEEFKRVTEVAYLGFVYGTHVALSRMLPRDRGTIVQVGSALGYRSIPLQSAYCGAKHAINGFTESIRTELLHDKSNVHITVAQMPAVNTPQFSWVLSRLPDHPQPVPPIYQPEVAARGVVFAADHPQRKQYWIGAGAAYTIFGSVVLPPCPGHVGGHRGSGGRGRLGSEGLAASAMNRFAAVRAGYGALLLDAPGPVIRLYSGQRADPRTRMVARLLGARHLAQAVATAGPPERSLLALGVEADLAHTASMLTLAAIDRERRRLGMVDAVSAGSFAVVGAVLTRHAGRAAIAPFHSGEGVLGGLAALRNRLVAGLARWLLPASLRAPEASARRPAQPRRPDRTRDCRASGNPDC